MVTRLNSEPFLLFRRRFRPEKIETNSDDGLSVPLSPRLGWRRVVQEVEAVERLFWGDFERGEA